MKRIAWAALATGILALGSMTGEVAAGERKARVVEQGPQFNEHPNSKYYRGQGPQVRGFVKRRGGYSYSYNDSVTDYRDTSILRDSQTSRRQGGPFDNGFFFDSGASRYNDSPYH